MDYCMSHNSPVKQLLVCVIRQRCRDSGGKWMVLRHPQSLLLILNALICKFVVGNIFWSCLTYKASTSRVYSNSYVMSAGALKMGRTELPSTLAGGLCDVPSSLSSEHDRSEKGLLQPWLSRPRSWHCSHVNSASRSYSFKIMPA